MRIRISGRGIVIAAVLSYPLSVLFGYRIFLISVFVAVLLFTGRSVVEGGLSFPRTSLPFSLFALSMVASLLWSTHPHETVRTLTILTPMFGIFAVSHVSALRARGEPFVALFKILPVFLLILSIGITLKYGSVRATDLSMKEAVGSFGNHAVAMVVLCIPPLFAMSFFGERGRFGSRISLLAAITTLILGGSRSGYLLLFFLIFSLPLGFGQGLFRKIKLAVTNIILVAAVLLPALSFSAYRSSLVSVWQRFHESQILQAEFGRRGEPDYARTIMYLAGVEAIREHPMLGVGAGSLRTRIQNEYGFDMVSHNILISAWGEGGLLGLSALLVLVFYSFRGVSRRIRDTKIRDPAAYKLAIAVGLSLLVGLLHAQTRPQLTNPLFVILLANSLAMNRIARPEDLHRNPAVTGTPRFAPDLVPE